MFLYISISQSNMLLSRDQSGEESRELGVAFEDLRVTGVGTPISYQPTFTSQFNLSATIEAIQLARHSEPRVILSEFEGTVTPGEMLCMFHACTTVHFYLRLSQWYLVAQVLDVRRSSRHSPTVIKNTTVSTEMSTSTL